MASATVFVLDAAFKRTQVKVTPGTHMRDVLEQACKARQWSPESYALKTQTNKTLDLSQPFRLSGLTSGAKLTLVQASRTPSVVNVALQLPEIEGGGRLSDKFPSTTSLWLILRKFEDAVAGQPPTKRNLTQRSVPTSQTSGSGRLEYEQPCLHLTGRNMESFADLQKTLAQLGLNSGSVLIRLSFKSVGQPMEEAMQEIEQYFRDVDAPSKESEAAASVPASGLLQSEPEPEPDRDSPMPDADIENKSTGNEAILSDADPINASTDADSIPHIEAPPPEDTLTSPASHDSTTENTNSIPAGISVYRPPTNTTPAAALYEEDPQTFEPSIDHAKAHQAALNRSTQNKRLLSDKELAEQAAAQEAALAEVKTVAVRVRYPDQSMIETTITATSTAQDLYAQVNNTLASADAVGSFQLKFTGNKGFQDLPDVANKRLVKDFGFRGRVIVTFVWADSASGKARDGPILKQELREAAKDLKIELGTQRQEGEASHKAAMEKKPTGGGKGKSPADFENKMKKLLGFGKK